jgi:hypothetical protein
MEGVVYVLAVWPFMSTPPAVYQRYCPLDPPEAVNVTADVPHAEFPVAPGAAGNVLIVAVTAALVLSQLDLSTSETR